MGKVKLTQEQADAIETQRKIIERAHERLRNNHQCNLAEWEYKLLELSTEEYMDACFGIGYEVEPEYKVGDWITFDGKYGEPEIVEIEALIYSKYWREECAYWSGGKCLPLTKIRHATPEEIAKEKQRIWWAKHGRAVWELKENDSILNQSEHDWYPDIIKSTNEFNVELSDREYIPWHLVKRDYKVFCFAEDRKDINQ